MSADRFQRKLAPCFQAFPGVLVTLHTSQQTRAQQTGKNTVRPLSPRSVSRPPSRANSRWVAWRLSCRLPVVGSQLSTGPTSWRCFS